MYLNASTDKIEIALAGNVTTNQLNWNVSWQDITSAGMTLPQSGGAGNTNNTTSVDMISAPAASTMRQVTHINVYNADTVNATVIIRKDVSTTDYLLVRVTLATQETLQWSRESGWEIAFKGGTGGSGITTIGVINSQTKAADGAVISGSSLVMQTADGSFPGLVSTAAQTFAGLKTFSGNIISGTVTGSTSASGTLTLSSTSNATKGNIIFGNSVYDEVNNRLGIGTSTPLYTLEVKGSITASSALAQLVNFEPTLTASANNDFLVATNINATFSLGAFTGTSPYLQRWQTAGFTRSFIRNTGLQLWNLNSGTVEAGRIEYGTPGGNTGMAIFDYDTATSTYINRYNFANEGTYFYQGFHSINTLGGMALFNTSHNLVLGYTGTPTDAGYKLDVNGTTRTQGDFTISDAKNIILNTTTGTKIATATNQKLGFWNAAPIVQPTTAVAAATRVGGGGTTVTDTDTFDGYTIAQVVKALRNTGILA